MYIPPVSLVGLVLIAWELYRRRVGAGISLDCLKRFAAHPWLVRTAALTLAPWFALQTYVLFLQAHLENGGPVFGWLAALPIVVYNGRLINPSVHGTFSTIALMTAILETACLAIIVVGASAGFDAARSSALWIAGTLLAGTALTSPAMATTDPYEYIQCGFLGLHSYAAQPHALPAAYAFIAEHLPVRGLIYGPLWLGIDTAVTSFGNSPYAKIEALRAFNAVVLLVLAVLVRWVGAPRGASVAVALNPALWFQSVLNPHSDIWGIAILTAAYGLARRERHKTAAVFLAFTGLVKLPFLVLGAAALVGVRPGARRFTLLAAAAGGALAISYLLAGPQYFADLLGYTHGRFAHMHPWEQDVRTALFVGVLVLTLAGLWTRRFLVGTAWLAPHLSPLPFPWYAIWGMPYAIGEGEWFTLFLVSLPFCNVLRDFNYDVVTFGTAVALGIAFALAISTARHFARSHPCNTGDRLKSRR